MIMSRDMILLLVNIEVGGPYTFSLLCYYFLMDTQALD